MGGPSSPEVYTYIRLTSGALHRLFAALERDRHLTTLQAIEEVRETLRLLGTALRREFDTRPSSRAEEKTAPGDPP